MGINIQYEVCAANSGPNVAFVESTSKPYNGGNTAAPAMPITSNDEPILVNLPNPDNASGHIAGHMSELANPKSAMQPIDTYFGVNSANTVKIVPSTAEYTRAFCCDIYLGIKAIPAKYPITMQTSVPDAR